MRRMRTGFHNNSPNPNSSIPQRDNRLDCDRGNMRNQSPPVDDDDLRSLLSGESSSDPRKYRPTQLDQAQGSGHITHLQSLVEENASVSAIGTNQMGRSNSGGSKSNSNSSINNKSSNQHSKRARVLLVIGLVILAVALLGPSGMLWDLLGVEDTSGRSDARVHHGDKHHQLATLSSPHNEPMNNVEKIRPLHAMQLATATQGRHRRFGDRQQKNKRKGQRKRKKKNNNKHKAEKGGWGTVKDAIENLDKVFLENRPVAATVMRKKKIIDEQDDEFLADDDLMIERETNMIPVVHDADSDANAQARLDANVNALDTYTNTQLPASDALECRASVIAFVINATDVRDECDGLRKAFDKTCSVVHGKDSQGGVPVAAAGGGRRLQRRYQRRRRLSERGRPHLWNLLPEELSKLIRAGRKKIIAVIVRMGTRLLAIVGNQNGSIYEAEITDRTTGTEGQEAYAHRTRSLQKMRSYQTESRDHNNHHSPFGSNAKNKKRMMRNLREEREVVSSAIERQLQQPQQKPIEQQQPIISLNIPTADKHISEEMLNDALLLQESESDAKPIKEAIMTPVDDQMHEKHPREEAPNKTFDNNALQVVNGHDHPLPPPPPQVVTILNQNDTAASEAVKDAAESASAIRTAVETVKNSMNDAKSVEARTCCASILSVFHEHCDPTTSQHEDYSDRRLLIVVFVITVCGIVKSLIRHLNIRWLPEAGGCILVGVFGYLVLEHLPHVKFAFDGDMFLRIMVPPIVFEAAVKINKFSFRRHIVPICIFAILGTLASTAFTAIILHKGTSWLGSHVVTIPFRESVIFGALISSIDPIAVLSILNSMGMTDSDTIYVLIFGESLLNDGVAIVLFQTLVHFLDESLTVNGDVVFDAFMHFVVVALGSVTVGVLSGACATIYFSLMRGCQTPMVEVIMFCSWAFMPYYICDMIEWSGIVAIVANGFTMDLFVIGQKHGIQSSGVDDEIDFLVNGGHNTRAGHHRHQLCQGIFNYEGHLSSKADSHIHFVIEIFATLMETAIFAYLGLFLFSDRYHWSMYLTLISIFATVMGRILMIPLFSQVSNILNEKSFSNHQRSGNSKHKDGVHIDCRMQSVLVFAGLRGAMSFALVEHIPMFDTTSLTGSRLKPELKAMTSASVIFTVFVLGGATSYLMERLGYSLNKQQMQQDNELEMFIVQEKRRSPTFPQNHSLSLANNTNRTSVRQRGSVMGR